MENSFMNLNQNEKCLLTYLCKYCDSSTEPKNGLISLLKEYKIELKPIRNVWANPVYEIIENYERV